MTIEHFNTLSLSKKQEIVWEWGFYICNRRNPNHTVAVFLIGDFFTEVHISAPDNTTIDITAISNDQLSTEVILELKDNPFIKAKLFNAA